MKHSERTQIYKALQGGQLHHYYRKQTPLDPAKFDLRPGGVRACEIDIWSTGEMYRDWPEGGSFIYTRADLEQMLRNAVPPERMIKLSIDFQHELASWCATTNYGAVGSIDPASLYLEDRDGLTYLRGYAEWNNIGLSLLQNGQARYISPAIISHGKRTRKSENGAAGEDLGYVLFNVGLVTEPFNDRLQEVNIPLAYAKGKGALTSFGKSSSLYQSLFSRGLRAFAVGVPQMDYEKYKTFLVDLLKSYGLDEAKAMEAADKAIAECKAMAEPKEEMPKEENATAPAATASSDAATTAVNARFDALGRDIDRLFSAIKVIAEGQAKQAATVATVATTAEDAAKKAKAEADKAKFSADRKQGKHVFFSSEKDAADTFAQNRAEYDRVCNRAPTLATFGAQLPVGQGARPVGLPNAPATLPTAEGLGLVYGSLDPYNGAQMDAAVKAEQALTEKEKGIAPNMPGNTYAQATERVSAKMNAERRKAAQANGTPAQ
jgi:hypothetical protein